MGTDIVNYNSAYAAAAEQYAAEEQLTGGTFLTVRGGLFKFGDEDMGTQVAVVIVDSVFENTFYEDKFDPDDPMPPKCYAFARGAEKDEMAPDPDMMAHEFFEIQNEDGCKTCPLNEFGSADTGRGKACQNRRRLAILPAGFYVKQRGSRDFELDLIEDVDHYAKSEIAFLKLPVTSTKAYAKYVTALSAQHQRPPFGVVTRIYITPDGNDQFHLNFEMVDLLPEELAPVVFARNEEAQKTIITPYGPPQEKPAKEARGADRTKRASRR